MGFGLDNRGRCTETRYTFHYIWRNDDVFNFRHGKFQMPIG